MTTTRKTKTPAPIGETNKTGFEIAACGRCGGSGRYSFNLMHGDRCYGCGGSGKVYTKRGAQAKKYLAELRAVPVAALVPGALVWCDFYGLKPVWRTLEAIEADTLNPGQNRVTLRFKMTPDGKRPSLGTFTTASVTSLKDEAERLATLAQALAYQSSL
jgi:uncharacterized protein (DUF983 family)